jgi:hypothetical protein
MKETGSGRGAAMRFVSLLVAPLVYMAGLLSPLTPSYGMPGVTDLVVFWLLPMAWLITVWLRDKSLPGRVITGGLLALILGSYIWILYMIWRTL